MVCDSFLMSLSSHPLRVFIFPFAALPLAHATALVHCDFAYTTLVYIHSLYHYIHLLFQYSEID